MLWDSFPAKSIKDQQMTEHDILEENLLPSARALKMRRWVLKAAKEQLKKKKY